MIGVIALIASVVLGMGGCGLCLGLKYARESDKPKGTANVYVYCDGSPSSGYTCNVTHTSGNARALACWDIRVSCHNGVRVNGHACQIVSPASKVTRFVRSADLTTNGRCNGSASTAVENVTVSALQ